MKTLSSLIPINNYPQSSPQFFLFHFPSLSRENPKSLNFSHNKCLFNPKSLNLSPPFKPSCASSYGGWDDSGTDLVNSDESSYQLRSFLISIGLNDKKYVYVFLLGFICALAISRVRISSLVLFPASALVFATGVSIGYFRLGENFSRKGFKEDIHNDSLRVLLDFFDRLENTLVNLKKDIQSATGSNKVTLNNLEDYVNIIESISSSALKTRNVVEASINASENSNGLVVESQISSRKKKEVGEVGFELLKFAVGLFGEKMVDSKPSKVKDNVKQAVVETLANDQSSSVVETVTNPFYDVKKTNLNLNYSQELSTNDPLDQDGGRRMKIRLDGEEMSFGEIENGAMRFTDNKEFRQSYNSMNMDNKRKIWKSNNNLLDSVGNSISFKHVETEASFVQEQMLTRGNRAYRSSSRRTEKSRNKTYSTRFRKGRVKSEDGFVQSEVDSSSSYTVSDDVLFDKYLTEANNLLMQAKECIRDRKDEDHAEVILYKSAKILSQAVDMKPMSLMAVGQLGNTYLLHGELKLKFSRKLRGVLRGGDPLYVEQKRFAFDDQVMNKDKVASVLVDVCEECEKLLVEAGRKYRLALSIDRNDVRALYNWGLALSFRAQLIADIGPEAAFDADKIFLAAIDKFDAMMSKGNVYTPDALFRWGVALQQRSYLRPSNSKEKVKLLQQASRLYQDAIDMEPNNHQAREALLSCASELDYRHF